MGNCCSSEAKPQEPASKPEEPTKQEEPATKQEEPAKKPKAAPVPPSAQPQNEPIAEAQPADKPEPEKPKYTPEQERQAARVVYRALARNYWRSGFLKDVARFKMAEKERLDRIAKGKAGSIGCAIDKNTMKIRPQGWKAEGPAAQAGLKPGDLVLAARTKGRGGVLRTAATTTNVQFQANTGPANEVFEGTEITLIVCRDEADQEKFQSLGLKVENRTDKAGTAAWLKAMHTINTIECNVVVGPQSEGAKRTRRKQLAKRKEDLGLDKMDIELVNNFMSDPDSCRDFTRRVFENADDDKSGQLSRTELVGVFKEMAEYTGVDEPTEKEREILFYLMDDDASDAIAFDEFYPHFRAHQIRACNAVLFENEEDDE